MPVIFRSELHKNEVTKATCSLADALPPLWAVGQRGSPELPYGARLRRSRWRIRICPSRRSGDADRLPDAQILLRAMFPRSIPGDPVRDKIAEVDTINLYPLAKGLRHSDAAVKDRLAELLNKPLLTANPSSVL